MELAFRLDKVIRNPKMNFKNSNIVFSYTLVSQLIQSGVHEHAKAQQKSFNGSENSCSNCTSWRWRHFIDKRAVLVIDISVWVHASFGAS